MVNSSKAGKLRISRRLLVAVVIVIFSVSAIVTGGVIAKYASIAKDELSNVTADRFYFESNYLTSNGHTYQLNAGTSSVSVMLYNYENDLRVSELDTVYTVRVISQDTSFKLNGEVRAEQTVSVGTVKTDIEILLEDLKGGYEYEVKVTADAGYVKTLSAKFKVAAESSGFFMNTDSSDESCVILTVWSENITGSVNLTVPEGLIPDATDPTLAGVRNYEGGKYVGVTVTDSVSFTAPYSSHSYRFFKTADYDPDAVFTVELGEVSATESNIP